MAVKSRSSEIVNRIAAGPFGAWLSQTRAGLRGNGRADVPCGDCIGCCNSSYFIHVRPEESQTLAVIPARFLVSAHGRPQGHMLMGFSPDGLCPMLVESRCSIYQQRPRSCQDYDCRVFAAAGIDAGGEDKAVINQRVRAWQYTYASEADTRAHSAVRAAAAFVQTHAADFPGGRVPTAPSDIAVLAIKVYTVFLEPGVEARSTVEIANAIVNTSREFDKGVES